MMCKYKIGELPPVGTQVYLRGDGPYTVNGHSSNRRITFSDRKSDWNLYDDYYGSACESEKDMALAYSPSQIGDTDDDI